MIRGMSRVALVHWKAEELAERAERLRSAGHDVQTLLVKGGDDLRSVRGAPPDAFVIDLSRMPSHGRAVATFLRQQKATRKVPIVFVGGDPEKVAVVRGLLPDAVFGEWTTIRKDLARALARPPGSPVVPATAAGYSGTPLPKKLGISQGHTVTLLGAPDRFEETLGTLPDGVRLRSRHTADAAVIVLFVRSQAELRRKFAAAAARSLGEKGRLWISWPKKTSALAGDLSEGFVREFGLQQGFVDYKVCAVDETWSGLCFARRKNA